MKCSVPNARHVILCPTNLNTGWNNNISYIVIISFNRGIFTIYNNWIMWHNRSLFGLRDQIVVNAVNFYIMGVRHSRH